MAKRNPLIHGDEDGMCHLLLTEPEIEALLNVLQLAKSAATVLAQQEVVKGTSAGSAKMTRMASEANELMRIIAESVRIGEPTSAEVN
jgi:Trp operon repressor